MIIWHYIFAALWFFLPGGIGNSAPVVASRFPVLKKWQTPLDFHKSWHGKRLLGDNKTWRGLITGVTCAGIVCLLQFTCHLMVVGVRPHTDGWYYFAAGALMGLGALAGDAIESFFKRQRGTPAGKAWFPFDQVDYIIGGLVISYPLLRPNWQLVVTTVLVWFSVHLLSVYLAFLGGLKDSPI